MELRIIVVGRDKQDPLCKAADEYLERLSRSYKARLIEVREEPAKSSTPAARVREMEAERIGKHLSREGRVIALDERGRPLDSVEISKKLASWSMEGLSSVSFVIGGPLGLAPSLVAAAHETWSLSRLTLPHRLARLVLSEQLYRAATILRGEPYHK